MSLIFIAKKDTQTEIILSKEFRVYSTYSILELMFNGLFIWEATNIPYNPNLEGHGSPLCLAPTL
jgi:hypothetical protein